MELCGYEEHMLTFYSSEGLIDRLITLQTPVTAYPGSVGIP